MKKRIISLLLAAALAASLCACGEQQAADGGSLRLYCPADLSEQNKSAAGRLHGGGIYRAHTRGDAAAELYRHRRNGVGGHEQRIRPADRY